MSPLFLHCFPPFAKEREKKHKRKRQVGLHIKIRQPKLFREQFRNIHFTGLEHCGGLSGCGGCYSLCFAILTQLDQACASLLVHHLWAFFSKLAIQMAGRRNQSLVKSKILTDLCSLWIQGCSFADQSANQVGRTIFLYLIL